MIPFSRIAIPHKDILEGRLTEDIFAADLWEVFKGRGPEDYRDPVIFFRKTYITEGLRNLLEAAERRLNGKGGDSVIQIQTPFGGGKTHSLIALYHKAREWGAKVVVIDCTALDPREKTLWGEMEEQLTGKIKKFEGQIPPGSEKLREVLEENQPLLILMDEVLQYATKAAGIKVGDSNLAAQVLAFLHELTKTVRSLERCLLVLTLSSSLLERYDESAEKLFQQLQKITGRMEKVYSPVKDEEVASVIRRRLFSSVDEEKAAKIVDAFLDYAEREGLLPEGVERSEYRRRFLSSYPFQPEVIDILYTRWGSFITFQRTRGVLRLLSLVVYSLKDSRNPFIRLGDFDLGNDDIRRELIKHIGSEYDSVLASDITGSEAGAKKVDRELGKSYSAYCFGTKVATAIFMCSFSGGVEKGVTLADLKLACSEPEVPSSVIDTVLLKLKEKLFYLQSDGKLFFSDQPNLNRILLTKMENVTDEEIINEEKKILSGMISSRPFKVYIWPENARDIPDTRELKLVVLRNFDETFCRTLTETYGDGMRVHRNTLIFLCPSDRASLNKFLREKIAWESIRKDDTLSLTESQKKDVADKIRSFNEDAARKVREIYRLLYLPSKDGFRSIDLGIPAHGVRIILGKEVFERLKDEGLLAERMDPIFLKNKYLKGKDYINVKALLDSFYNTPGELMLSSEDVLKETIKKGVADGLFGYGILENGRPICKQFEEELRPEITEDSIIIQPELCKAEIEGKEEEKIKVEEVVTKEEKVVPKEVERPSRVEGIREYNRMCLRLDVPLGRISDIARMLPYLRSKFEEVNVKVEILASKGKIGSEEYKRVVRETLEQSNIKILDEELD